MLRSAIVVFGLLLATPAFAEGWQRLLPVTEPPGIINVGAKVDTMGVFPDWDDRETIRRFDERNIREKGDPLYQFQYDVSDVVRIAEVALEEMVKSESQKGAWSSALRDVDMAKANAQVLDWQYKDCQYWENGLKPRTDVAFIAICFYKAVSFSKKEAFSSDYRQILIMPFFKSSRSAETVKEFLTEEYGQPLKDEPNWWTAKFLGQYPVKYIFLTDIPEAFKTKYGVSTAIAYFDVDNLEGYQSDRKDLAEKKKKADEQERKEERKGL